MRTAFRFLSVPALLLLAAVAVLVSARDTVEAVGFHVNVTYDAVDANPGDFVCETALGNGECTLRAAIMEANALPGADPVTLGEREYELSIGDDFLVGDEDTGVSGDIDILDDLILRGSSATSSILNGGYTGSALDILDGVVVDLSDVTVQGVNTTSPGQGTCGTAIRNRGTLIAAHTIVRDNFGRHVGAICNGGDLTLSDSIVTENRTGLSGYGAGLHNGGTAKLMRVEVSANGATYDGGGIRNTGSLTITDSLIKGNVAQDIFYGGFGGGVYNDGGDLSVINTTFTNNSGDGGAIANTGSAVLVNVTIANNRRVEDDIGGVYNTGDLTLTNTIIASNEGGDCAGSVTSGGNNLDSDGSCGLAGDGDLSGVDPLLGELADNGGPTMTHALLDGSPAIDAGDDDACPETDQRGAPRPVATCDVGAYEANGVVPPTATPKPPAPPARGDVDCDGDVDSTDGLALLRFLVGAQLDLPDCPPIAPRADVNCDGRVDVLDALALLRYVAGLEVALPPGCEELG